MYRRMVSRQKWDSCFQQGVNNLLANRSGGADNRNIDAAILNKVIQFGELLPNAILFRFLSKNLYIRITNGNDLKPVWVIFISLQMKLCDTTCTDKTHLIRFHFPFSSLNEYSVIKPGAPLMDYPQAFPSAG